MCPVKRLAAIPTLTADQHRRLLTWATRVTLLQREYTRLQNRTEAIKAELDALPSPRAIAKELQLNPEYVRKFLSVDV